MKSAKLRTFLILGSILPAALYALYRILFRLLEKATLRTHPNGKATPADFGLEYEDLPIRSGSRQLQAWFVPAAPSNDLKKAVLIYHGVDECISDWIPPLQYLHEHGFSALVFDYSGFGSSQGRASLANLRQDAQAAYRAFLSKAAVDSRKYALGYSLGSGVLLEAAPSFASPPAGLILVAAFTSARDAAVRLGGLPACFTFLIPDFYNNVLAVQRVKLPLLIVHSQDDELFPVTMPSKIYAAAPEPKRLVVLNGLRHNAMLEGQAGEYLAPVVFEGR